MSLEFWPEPAGGDLQRWMDDQFRRLAGVLRPAGVAIDDFQSLLAVDTINDWLGVDVASPAAKLHVHEPGTGASDHAFSHFTTGDTAADLTEGLTVGYDAGDFAAIVARSGSELKIETDFSAPIKLATNSSTAVWIDENQNIGIGIEPEAWNSGRVAIQLGGTGAFWNTTGQAAGGSEHWTSNLYFDEGGAVRHIVTDEAADIYMANGEIIMRVASSAAADAVASFSTGLRIYNDGTLAFGLYSSITTETLQGYIPVKDLSGITRKVAIVA